MTTSTITSQLVVVVVMVIVMVVQWCETELNTASIHSHSFFPFLLFLFLIINGARLLLLGASLGCSSRIALFTVSKSVRNRYLLFSTSCCCCFGLVQQ